MAKRRKNRLGILVGAAAIAGAVAAIVKLEREAKERDADILDVAKEKIDSLIEDVKSGDIANKADTAAKIVTDFANKTVEDVKSGEFQKNVTEQFNKTVDEIKSGEALEKASKIANEFKDGVNDIFDGKED